MLVTCDQDTSSQNNKSAAEIVAQIQSTAGGKGEIIGARKLPKWRYSSDIQERRS